MSFKIGDIVKRKNFKYDTVQVGDLGIVIGFCEEQNTYFGKTSYTSVRFFSGPVLNCFETHLEFVESSGQIQSEYATIKKTGEE
jgi:hypothetical protein